MTSMFDKQGPIEVWLSQRNGKITCRVVFEDESTLEPVVDSRSLRGAQREITGRLVEEYEPVAREPVDPGYDAWGSEVSGEVVRRFVPKKSV